MKIHPLADLFPDMTKEDFATLVADIEANGLLEPISTHKGEIIDGKHRFKACAASKTKPTFIEYTGDDPLGYVISRNLSRRHLEVHDKALIAAKICNGKRGGDRKSDQSAAGHFDISEAAKVMNVSERSIKRAKHILETGSAKLIALVRAGEIPLTYAVAIARLKKAEQDALLRDPRKRKAATKRKRKDPNKEAPLNSHAWACANAALRQKWIDAVGVKSIWEAMTDAQKDQLLDIAEAEEAEGDRLIAASAS